MRRIRPRDLPQLASFVTLALLLLVASLSYPGFFSLRVLVGLFTDQAYLGVVAVGMTFVILAGGIDLSVGAVAALSASLIAALVGQGWHPLPAMGAAVLLAGLFGAAQGAVVARFGLPSFLVTLAGMFLARGTAFAVLGHATEIEHGFYLALWELRLPLGGGASVPAEGWVLLAVLVLGLFVQVRTPFGRSALAVGGDPESARLMGLPVVGTLVRVFALSGLCAGLGGALATIVMESGNPAGGRGLELEAIACVVIGGTLLTGGVGGVLGTLAGILTFGALQAAIVFDGRLSVSWTRIVMGGMLLGYVLLQRVLVRRRG